MSSITFLYLAFGDNFNNHSMANFSLLTFKKFAPANSRFVIYTDRPEYYQYSSTFVEIRLMTKKTMEDWQGQFNFVWRIKIMAMLDSAEKDLGHLVYVDTDTFALQDFSSMIEKLDQEKCFMHVRESLLSEDKALMKKRMWQQAQYKNFGGMIVDKTSAMWNAGVVGLDSKNKIELLTKALLSTDEMCEQNIEKWLIEQFSLSQALSSTGKLEATDKWIAHYWGNKEEMTQNIHLFFSKIFQEARPQNEILSLIEIDFWKKFLLPKKKISFLKSLINSF